MWLLLAVNAVMLAGLLFTLWRLHHLKAVLAIQRAAAPAAAHYAVKPGEPRRRESPRQSALDEFPSETGPRIRPSRRL
jgi:hypothetical protein